MLSVLVCSRRLSAHSVFLVAAGCLGPCLCAPVLALLVLARGLVFVLECAVWGFLPLFVLLHLFPLFRVFVTESQGCAVCFVEYLSAPVQRFQSW